MKILYGLYKSENKWLASPTLECTSGYSYIVVDVTPNPVSLEQYTINYDEHKHFTVVHASAPNDRVVGFCAIA